MNRLKALIFLILLSSLISGCQIYPYVYEPATGTPTEISLPTSTPKPTQTSLPASPTPESTATIEPTFTSEEPAAELTPEKTIQFNIQEGSPMALPNFANPSAGCEWMGVAGQVFDEEHHEILNLIIVSGNTLEEGNEELTSLTGEALAYGPGGYEIQLTDRPVETSQTFWIEIRRQDGTVLSNRFFFDTYEDCERNLILINLVPIQASEDEKTIPMPESSLTPEAYP